MPSWLPSDRRLRAETLGPSGPETKARRGRRSLIRCNPAETGMIVRARDSGLLVINQAEHAHLASRLAEHWGNGRFSRPTPFADMVLATLSHDDGWIYRDRSPAVNRRTGSPSDFYELPMESVLAIHQDSVRLTASEPSYAAMMVSMHRTGLCRNRYSTQEGWEDRANGRLEAQVKKFVVREEARQRRVGKRLRRDPHYGRLADQGHVWTNYELIQVWDRLALYVCGVEVGATLSPTPTKYGAADTTLTLARPSRSRVSVKPWPFASESLKLDVDARLISDRKYASSGDLAEELFSSPALSLHFELR